MSVNVRFIRDGNSVIFKWPCSVIPGVNNSIVVRDFADISSIPARYVPVMNNKCKIFSVVWEHGGISELDYDCLTEKGVENYDITFYLDTY